MGGLHVLALVFLLPGGDEAAVRKSIEDFRQSIKDAKTVHEKALAILAFGEAQPRDASRVVPVARFLTPAPADLNSLLPTSAAAALGNFRGERAAAQVLVQALAVWKKSPYVRKRILLALGRVGHEAGLPIFEEHLRGPDPELAIFAVDAIAEMPASQALEALFREGDRMEQTKDRLGDAEKKAREKVAAHLLRTVKRLSGQPYISIAEFRIWWTRRGEDFRRKAAEAEKERASAKRDPSGAAPVLPPILIVELLFSQKGAMAVANTGSSSGLYPTATLTPSVPEWSDHLAASSGPHTLDFGKNPGPHAVDLGGPSVEHLKTLKSFTIAGWFNLRAAAEGPGGNRMVTWLEPGRDGVELVQRADGSVQLGVNQPAEASPARTPGGLIPVIPDTPADALHGTWRFVAVAYDSTASAGHVKVYVGPRHIDAALAATIDYARGPAGAQIAPQLSIGNVGPFLRKQDPSRMFRGWIDDVRVFGSTVDGSGALSLPQVLALQNRE